MVVRFSLAVSGDIAMAIASTRPVAVVVLEVEDCLEAPSPYSQLCALICTAKISEVEQAAQTRRELADPFGRVFRGDCTLSGIIP